MPLAYVMVVILSMMKRFLLYLLLLINSTLLCSQNQGVVLSVDNQPLNEVSIFLGDQNILLYTNEKGVFLINEDLPNNSFLEFSKLGYKTQVIQYKSDQEIKVLLEKLHIELDEIGVQETVSVLGSSKMINVDKKSLVNNFILSS